MRIIPLTLAAGLLTGLLALSPATQPIPRREFQPAAGNGRVAAFSATGNLLAVSGGTPAVAVFQTRTGLLLRTYAGHNQFVTDLAFAPHPDTVLSADAAGRVRLWSAESLTTLRRWQAPTPLLAVAFAPGGGQAVLASDRACWLWDLRGTGAEPVLLKLVMPAKSAITAVTFGADGRQLALGFDTGGALVYNFDSGTQTQKSFGTAAVCSLWLRADTLLAATGTPDLKIWPVRPEAAAVLLPLPQKLLAVAAGPDGRALALGFDTGEAMRWNRAANRADFVCRGQSPARRVQFQPDGELLLTTYDTGGPKTWLLE